VHDIIASRGYEAEIIPGVPSFCAVAARLGTSLTTAGEPMTVIPASYTGLSEMLDMPGTKVLMKSGKAIEEVKSQIARKGLSGRAMAVSNCGMEGEAAYRDISGLGTDYFTVILIGPKEENTECCTS